MGWFTCYVIQAGPAEDGAVYINLQERTNKFECWFTAHPEIRRDALSVAIAAMVNGIKVAAIFDSDNPQQYDRINRIYLSKY